MKRFLLIFSSLIIIFLVGCDIKSNAKCTVNFYSNDDNMTIESFEIEKNTEVDLSLLSAYTKEGYIQEFWYSDKNYTTKVEFPFLITQDTSFYLNWVKNTGEIFDINFVCDNTIYETFQIEMGSRIQTPENPLKEGYLFKGWSINKTSFQEYNIDSPIINNLTLYAFWDIISYKVSYIVDGNIYHEEKIDYNTTTVSPENPNKEGFIFDGWFTNNNTLFDFNTPITSEMTLTAKFTQNNVNNTEIIVNKCEGFDNGLYVEFNAKNNKDSYKISIKKENSSQFTEISKNDYYEDENSIFAYIIGLEAGKYTVKIENTNTSSTIYTESNVTDTDRSGYAHFNYSGVGAYTDKGTLKDNAIVVYVTNDNKNTVTATIAGSKRTGLVEILQACSSEKNPVCIRIIGEIQTTQWNYINHGEGNSSSRQNNLDSTFKYTSNSNGWDESGSSSKLYADKIISKGINSMSNDLNKGITELKGLTTFVSRAKKVNDFGAYEYDSYYNMLDVNSCSNITIEGIGPNAKIYQWGFNFKKCNSIEIKNLTFDGYTEDALGFEGSKEAISDYGNYWIHNCTFNIGVNNWDVCYEADKYDGDGSTDFKYCHNVTISYCQYNKTHKTNLIGANDSAKQYNFTLHHNYYNNCSSRLPLARQANIHMYNNYFYKTTGVCSSIRANCYTFFENNYYENCKNPVNVVISNDYSSTVVKCYENEYSNCSTSSNNSTNTYLKTNNVTSREEKITGNCNPTGTQNLTNFDTNSNLFYYDTENKVSSVKDLLSASEVKNHCLDFSGVLNKSFKSPGEISKSDDDSNNTTIPGDDTLKDSTIITFDSFNTGKISSTTTLDGITINPKTDKTCEIQTCDETINNLAITKYVVFGGGGSFSQLSILFETINTANITIYYSSSGSTQRYVALINEETKLVATTGTIPGKMTIVNHTFTNVEAGKYAIASNNSGINIYCIIITYNN